MTPPQAATAASENSHPLACAGCGQLLYPDQPMVSPDIGGALHIGCHRLRAIELRHGPTALRGETLPPLRP
jgi:hypothetical protein